MSLDQESVNTTLKCNLETFDDEDKGFISIGEELPDDPCFDPVVLTSEFDDKNAAILLHFINVNAFYQSIISQV